MAPKAFKADNNEVVKDGNDRADETVVDLSKSKNNNSEKLTRVLNIEAIEKLIFLIPNAKKTFNHLWLAFIKAPILQHFDLESHIRIKTNALGYTIGKVLSQLNLDSDVLLNNLNSKSNFGH